MWAVVNIRPEHKKKQQRLPLLRQKSTVCGIVHLCMYEDSAGFWLLFVQLWIWFIFWNFCLLLLGIIWVLLQDYNMIQTCSLWIFLWQPELFDRFLLCSLFWWATYTIFPKKFTQSFQFVVDVFFCHFKRFFDYALYSKVRNKEICVVA